MRRILLWLFCAIACFAMFDVPSAYAWTRGYVWWVALAVGLATFPVLPLAWHLWGERRGRDKKRQTSAWERFAFRTAAIALVVIGGLIVAARGATWRAMHHNALWFLPSSASGALPTDAAILQHVPGDAAALVWLRPNADMRETLGALTPLLKDAPELVGAIGRDENHAALFERGDVDLIEQITALVERARSVVGVDFEVPKSTTLSDGTRAWPTPGWSSAIDHGHPDALFALLRRVPDDAFATIVARPDRDSRELDGVTTVVAYVHVRYDELVAVADLDTQTAAQAAELVARAKHEIEVAAHRSSCIDTNAIDLAASGAHVHIRFGIDLNDLAALASCIDKT